MFANIFYLDNFWDIKKALMVQDSSNVILTFWIFDPSFLILLIFIL